jgi:predicted nucleotidyltransferase
MANYRYVPEEFEENHERFVGEGKIRVSKQLLQEYRTVVGLWSEPKPGKARATVVRNSKG